MKSEYVYCDELGNPLSRTVVFRSASGKRVFQEHYADGQWITGLNGTRNVPFRLPEILAAIADKQPVFIVEGEKDCITLLSHGLQATTNRGGAGHWTDEHSGLLRGGNFVVIPDNDEPGYTHAENVAVSLPEFANPESVRLIDLRTIWPIIAEKGDISDFFEAGMQLQALLNALESAPDLALEDSSRIQYPVLHLHSLPDLLQSIVRSEEKVQDQITLFMSSLVALGSLMPNVFMRIAGRSFAQMINGMVIGPPSSGKSLAGSARDLVALVQQEKRAVYKQRFDAYKSSLERNRSLKKGFGDFEQLPPPPQLALLAPGNSTSGVILDLLASNPSLLIAESEVDVASTMLRNEYGDLSGVLRQVWSHEPVSFARLKFGDAIDIPRPMLATLFAGTPNQLAAFFRDVDNGLVSRFWFHVLTERADFRNPFDEQNWKGASIASSCADDVKQFSDLISSLHPCSVEVQFTESQRKTLGLELEAVDTLALDDDDLVASTTRRNPVLIGRIATILTVVRCLWQFRGVSPADAKNVLLTNPLAVHTEDYQHALVLGKYALQAAFHVHSFIPESMPHRPHRLQKGNRQWYESLPGEVNRKHALDLASSFGIKPRTADRLLSQESLFERIGNGVYRKVSPGKVAK